MTNAGLPSYLEESPRRRLQVGVLWAVVAALFGTSVLAAIFVPGQAKSPEDAVRRLVSAAAKEDILGVIEALAPSERDAFKQPVQDIVSELKRLDVLGNDFDAGGVQGVDIEFEGVQLSSKTLADDISTVHFDAGTIRTTFAPRQLKAGGFLNDITSGSDNEVVKESEELNPPGDENDLELATVREGGDWYVSVAYTIAENARRETGSPAPNFGHGVVAKGEPTPEKAVDSMLRAAIALDLQRMIELTPPGEMRALHDYAPLFLEDAKRGAAEVGFRGEISDLQLEASNGNGERSVRIKSFKGAFDVDGDRVTISSDGNCAEVGIPGEPPERTCADDLAKESGLRVGLFSAAGLAPRFVVLEHDGAWFVSPTRTLLAVFVDTLKRLQKDDLDRLDEMFSGSGVEEQFQESGTLQPN